MLEAPSSDLGLWTGDISLWCSTSLLFPSSIGVGAEVWLRVSRSSALIVSQTIYSSSWSSLSDILHWKGYRSADTFRRAQFRRTLVWHLAVQSTNSVPEPPIAPVLGTMYSIFESPLELHPLSSIDRKSSTIIEALALLTMIICASFVFLCLALTTRVLTLFENVWAVHWAFSSSTIADFWLSLESWSTLVSLSYDTACTKNRSMYCDMVSFCFHLNRLISLFSLTIYSIRSIIFFLLQC